jgi:peptidoglycan/LPS O-acetylase OafA/YrhL
MTATPTTSPRPTGTLEALDGLRGLAALIVVASHASQQGLPLVPGLDLSGIGKSGVYLFFVISAFLLTAQWLSPPVGYERPPAGARLVRYFVRRTARIFPLYALVVISAWAMHPRSLGVPIDTPALWRHLALLEGRDLYWSVPVEFKYYLLIPVVAWLLARPLAAGFKVTGAALALALLAWAYPPWDTPQNSVTLGYYLPVFLCGSLAAWVAAGHLAGPDHTSARRRHDAGASWFDALVLAALLASIPALARLAWPDVRPDFLHHAYLPWGLFWSFVLLAVLAGKLPAWERICRTAALRACGRWCFGLYLLHLPALIVARKLPLPDLAQAWAGLALSLLAAALAHRLVERPAMDWASRLGAPSRR